MKKLMLLACLTAMLRGQKTDTQIPLLTSSQGAGFECIGKTACPIGIRELIIPPLVSWKSIEVIAFETDETTHEAIATTKTVERKIPVVPAVIRIGIKQLPGIGGRFIFKKLEITFAAAPHVFQAAAYFQFGKKQ